MICIFKKAQVATEYLVIVGIILVILIPLILLYFRYTSESSYSITSSRVNAISDEMINAANQVNVYGAETQVKLNIDFPENIQEIRFQDKEIIFKIIGKDGKTSEIAKVADTVFITNYPNNIYSPLNPGVVPGKKEVIVKSLGSSQVSVEIR